MYHSFEELEVWKKGCQLAVAVYEALGGTREFALRNQMQRAAVSIPSNIAEGAERGGKDFARFLRVARGPPRSFAPSSTSPGGSGPCKRSRSRT